MTVLVTVKGFGSVWERRLGRDRTGRKRFAQATYHNTTGVMVNGKVRYRWRIGGKIRFNSVGGFNANYPLRALNRVFECEEAQQRPAGWNQVLFKRMLTDPERPDLYLFVVTAERTGYIDIGSDSWKEDPVQVVSCSEDQDQQEIMLLMPAYSWLRGELGTFFAEPLTKQSWSAELRLGRP